MNVVYVLWLREMRRYVRSPGHVVASLGQPLIFLFILGIGFGPAFQKSGNGNYFEFVAPGVIGMIILFTSVLSGVPLILDREFGSLKVTLVAPVPRHRILIGRLLGGATIAMLQGLIVVGISVLAGLRPVKMAALPIAFLFMSLIASLFTAFGIAVGSVLVDVQSFPLIMNFLVMPAFFFSGALFPLSNLPKLLTYVTDLDPLSYGVDGLRTTLIGISHFGLAVDLVIVSTTTCASIGVASFCFSRIQS
jgi:ABC-2 type transport system permease protein